MTSSSNSFSGSGNATGVLPVVRRRPSTRLALHRHAKRERKRQRHRGPHDLFHAPTPLRLRRRGGGGRFGRPPAAAGPRGRPNDLRGLLGHRPVHGLFRRCAVDTACRRVDPRHFLAVPEQHHFLELQHRRFPYMPSPPPPGEGQGVGAIGRPRAAAARPSIPAAAASPTPAAGIYGGTTTGPNGTMSQSGGANESFSYTKNYSIDGTGTGRSRQLASR